MIKAILFDMDGVLIDARDWHYEALNKALGHFGFHISRHEHLTGLDGLPTAVKLDYLTKHFELPSGLHTIVSDLKQKYTLQYAATLCKPTFNHQYALKRLSKTYKLGLCSNSILSSIQTLTTLAQINDYFDLILSNQDVDEPKPSPAIYKKAMSMLSVKPEETLILEDSSIGITAAKLSGAMLQKVSSPEAVSYESIMKAIESSCSRK